MSSTKRGRWNQRHAESLQVIVAGELHREIAGEAVRAFHDDGTDAIGIAAPPGSKC
jgi:hypothetical protein